MADAQAKDTVKRDRSPSFPYIGLAKAVDRIQTVFNKVKRYEARVADIAGDWGLAPKSSSTDRTVAALISYGLVDDNGGGESRKIKVSEVGLHIIDDPRPGQREKYLALAALRPKIIAEYAEKWAGGRPDDAHALSQLKFDGGFTDEGARIFLRVFDETIRFLPAVDAAMQGASSSTIEREEQPPKVTPKVGDMVQWTSAGVDQFDAPKRVRGFQTHDGVEWAFVEGTDTGVPMAELTVVSAAAPPPLTPPVFPEVASVAVSAKEREWLRGPLSRDASYRLIVSGDLGPRDIGKLIKLLEAQKLILEDDEPADA